MASGDPTTVAGDTTTTNATNGNPAAPVSPESGTITLIIIICASVGGCIVVGGIMVIIGCCVLKPKEKVSSAYPTMGYSSQQNNFVPMDTMSVPQISDSPYQKTAGAYFPESSAGGTGDIYGVPNFDAAAKDASYTMFAGDSTARGTLQRTYTVPDLPSDPHDKPNY